MVPGTGCCSFCDGTLQKQGVESCTEAAGVELKKIVSQLHDLEDAEEDIIAEKEGLYEKSDTLKIERSMVEEVINSELKPKIQNLRQSLAEYRHSIEVHNEARVISRFERDMIYDLKEFEFEDESEAKYKPKEHFDSEIIETINMILDRILDTCNFDNYSSSYFSKDDFDVVVNGKHKAKHGKGYRAFLNTVVALAFMEYLTKYGVYSPGLLIVDSPILSLKEKGGEQASDSMKKSLFRYFLNNQDNGQMIIIENEIPELDYSNANLIHFTKDLETGRYGLLHNTTE